MHISIMVKEILDFCRLSPESRDLMRRSATAGTRVPCWNVSKGQGHIWATDVDPEESAKTKKRLEDLGFGEDLLTVRLQNFCTIDEIAKEVGGFDFILADLGVSSMQIDNPSAASRLRWMDRWISGSIRRRGSARRERLDTITREELAGMLYENSDEPYCEELAKAITDEIRRGQPHRHDDKAAQGDRGYAGFSAGEGEKGHNQKDLPTHIPGTAHRCEPGV